MATKAKAAEAKVAVLKGKDGASRLPPSLESLGAYTHSMPATCVAEEKVLEYMKRVSVRCGVSAGWGLTAHR